MLRLYSPLVRWPAHHDSVGWWRAPPSDWARTPPRHMSHCRRPSLWVRRGGEVAQNLPPLGCGGWRLDDDPNAGAIRACRAVTLHLLLNLRASLQLSFFNFFMVVCSDGVRCAQMVYLAGWHPTPWPCTLAILLKPPFSTLRSSVLGNERFAPF